MNSMRSRFRTACIVSSTALIGYGASIAVNSYFGGIQLKAGESSLGAKIIVAQGDKGNRGASDGDKRGGAPARGDGGSKGASGNSRARDGGDGSDKRGGGNAAEQGAKKGRAADDRTDSPKRVQEGKERGSGDRGGRDRAERGSRWSSFGGRGRRYHREGRIGFYFWAPWTGQYVYYNDFDSCYSASYGRCRSADYSSTYCKRYVRDLCAW